MPACAGMTGFFTSTNKKTVIPAKAGIPFILLLVFLGSTFPAFAADKTPPVDPVLCKALTKHVPNADVAYQPGVDVHGKPVAPADLEGAAQIKLPEEISIPLTADLFSFLQLDQSKFPFNALPRNDINLGTLTVRGDKVFHNGKTLTDAQQDNLAVLCLKPH